MRNNWYKKSLVVGIIVLFICVTFASGISFKVDLSKTVQIDVSNSELVKVPVSICRVDSVEDYEVSLTQQQVGELEDLIDNIKPEIDKVETLEETEELFRDTVSSMDELDILPDDMSVEEAQQLVTGDKYKLKPETCIRKRISQFLNAGLYNEYCYLYAKATNSGRMITYYFGETCEDLYG
jgi:TolA-binding protein